MGFFDGFELVTVDVPAGPMRLRHGGSGPPLLLLHGNPQTHAMWHKVAPRLAERFTVICPDLRGYGGSHKPPATADHAPYAKRAMAQDMADLMTRLGHDRFFVGSHDRGARVAHRLALDHAERVERLAILDIVPTIEHFERTDMAFALGYYHWFWFAQPHPFPEKLISAAPELWWHAHTSREPKLPSFFAPDALADYLAAARNPDMIRGMCEDYRAAATIDLVHDRESREAGRKIVCPLLVQWGSEGKIGGWYDAPAIWRSYCSAEVIGGPVRSGHYLAEEAPDAVLDARDDNFGGEADAFYEALLRAHAGLTDADSAALDARLILILANQVGDIDVLRAALDAARASLEAGEIKPVARA
jgi:haloacetate dehalogenase